VDMPDLFVSSQQQTFVEVKPEKHSSDDEDANTKRKNKSEADKNSSKSRRSTKASKSNQESVPTKFEVPDKQLREAAAREVAERNRLMILQSGMKRRRVAFVSVEEKEMYSKDRNREHARNTRLRKKIYIDKLKLLVQDLTSRKEREENEQKILDSRLAQQKAIMQKVLGALIQLRIKFERNRQEWAKILDDNFMFTTPITPYQSFNRAEIMTNSRVMFGIDSIIKDTASFGVMVSSIGLGSPKWKEMQLKGDSVKVVWTMEDEDVLVRGDMLMGKYELKTENAVSNGAYCECSQEGMIQCKFTPENKLAAVDMVFDVMSFMQQLQRSSGPNAEMPIVPNSLEMANLETTNEARFLMIAEHPYVITGASAAWETLMGYREEEVKDRCTITLLQGPCTDVKAMQFLIQGMMLECASGIKAVTHTKTGKAIVVFVRLLPLTSDSHLVTHFLGIIDLLTEEASDYLDDEGEGALLLQGLSAHFGSGGSSSSDDGYSSSVWLQPGMPMLGPTESVLPSMLSTSSADNSSSSNGESNCAPKKSLKSSLKETLKSRVPVLPKSQSPTPQNQKTTLPFHVQVPSQPQLQVPHPAMLLHHFQPARSTHAQAGLAQVLPGEGPSGLFTQFPNIAALNAHAAAGMTQILSTDAAPGMFTQFPNIAGLSGLPAAGAAHSPVRMLSGEAAQSGMFAQFPQVGAQFSSATVAHAPAASMYTAQFQPAVSHAPATVISPPYMQASWAPQLAFLPHVSGNGSWMHQTLPTVHALLPATNNPQAHLMSYQWSTAPTNLGVAQSDKISEHN